MRLRIMTYNIKAGRYHPDGLEAAVRVVKRHAPDILALQEVDEGMPRTNGVAQTDWLARRLRMRGLYAPALERDGGRYGIALLTRLPVQAHERRLLFRPQYPDTDRRPRHDSEPRVALAAVLDSAAGPLRVFVTHIGLTPDQRSVQAREVAAFADGWGGRAPALIAGDFNCDPDAPELEALRAGYTDACALRGVSGDARFTFPSGALGARAPEGWRGAIDTVWVSPGLTVHAARVAADESCASDHQPVIVDFSIGA
ncbi:MAG: endonuclease/exonuclease/phosphatase family protein [Chloroflexi bacterium]|nr:endonuclease/exonuclease/phosphatase family protein [Chloroflexota bacterium]